MSNAKPRIPDEIKKLTRSELEYIIKEANLGKEDTEIAEMYLIDKIPQIDIAIEKNVERCTISVKCKKIISRILGMLRVSVSA